MPKFKLSDIDTKEVSLVPKGANNKKFFLVKSADGDKVITGEEFIGSLLKSSPEKIEEVCKGLEPNVREALSVVFKLMQKVRETTSEKTINKLLSELNLGGSELIKGETQMPENETNANKPEAPKSDDPKKVENEGTAEVNTPAAPEKPAEEEVAKEAQVQSLTKENVELRKAHDELKKKFEKSENERITKEFVAKAGELKNLSITPAEFGPVLKSVNDTSPEAFEKVMTVLKAADEALAKSELFESKGSDAKIAGAGAWDKIEKLAAGMVEKSSDGLTKAKAIDLVLKSEEGKKLYSDYLNEVGGAA